MTKRSGFLFLIALALATLLGVMNHFQNKPANLYKDLISLNDEKRALALMRLDNRSDTEKEQIVQALLPYTTNENVDVQRFALYALRKTNKPTDAVFQAYLNALKDPSPSVKREATIALSESGEKGVAVLVKTLVNPDEELSELAYSSLKNMGASAVPHLVKALKNPAVKSKTVLLLVEIVPPPMEAKEPLRQMLRDNNKEVRYLSAIALTRLDVSAQELPPILNEALNNSQDGFDGRFAIRPAAARALAKVDPRRTALVDILWDLKQKNSSLRYRAAVSLFDTRPAPIGALSDLVKALDDTDIFVSARVTAALFNFEVTQAERVKDVVVKKIDANAKRIGTAQIPGYDAMIEQGLAKWRIVRPTRQHVDEDIEAAREITEPNVP